MGNPYSYTIKVSTNEGDQDYIEILQAVSYSDEGFYSCVAGNTLGETISSAFLQISTATFHKLDIRVGMIVFYFLWARGVL